MAYEQPPPAAPEPPRGSYPPGAYGQPYPAPYPYYGAGQPTEGMAIGALVSGIASFVICFAGIVTAVVAVVLGTKALDRIDASGGRLGGAGLAKAGRILGYVYLGLLAVGLVIAAIIAAAGGFDSNTSMRSLVGA